MQSQDKKRKGCLDVNNYLGTDSFLHPNANEDNEVAILTNATHVANGPSPSKDFVHNFLIGGVLCLKYVLG